MRQNAERRRPAVRVQTRSSLSLRLPTDRALLSTPSASLSPLVQTNSETKKKGTPVSFSPSRREENNRARARLYKRAARSTELLGPKPGSLKAHLRPPTALYVRRRFTRRRVILSHTCPTLFTSSDHGHDETLRINRDRRPRGELSCFVAPAREGWDGV